MRPPRNALSSIACWAIAVAASCIASVQAAPVEPAPPIVVADPLTEALWADRETVTVDELYAQLDTVADTIATSPEVRADYDALVAHFDLADSETLYRDYVRVKLAFEATRDAGWWNLSWKITNEKPNSEEIWRQWSQAAVPDPANPVPTAIAECDELSALFAFSARRMGVHGIGLLWPTWNHVVAVWTVQSTDGKPVRIVVPTSQIFLGNDDSLGTEGFNPYRQKTIYEYRRRDVKSRHTIDADLARFFVEESARHGGKSQTTLQDERNARDLRLMAALGN